MRLYARVLKAKHKPKYSLGTICQWIGGLVNSPLLARPAYGSSVLCSKDESGTASRTKPFIGNSWRYFSELCSVLDTTSIGAMHRIGVETSCLSISMIIEIISTIQGTNEGGITRMAYVLFNGVITIIIFLILSFHPNACIGLIPVGLLLYIRAADRKVNCKIWSLKKQRLCFDGRHILQYLNNRNYSSEELISDDNPDEFVKVYYMAKVCTDTQFSNEYIKVSASVHYDALLNKNTNFVLLEYQDKKRNTYSIDSEPKRNSKSDT